MGNCWKRCRKIYAEEKIIDVLLLGLDNAGKTSLANHLLEHLSPKESTTTSPKHLSCPKPTMGCHVYELKLSSKWLVRITEVGGAADIRDIWKHYFLGSMGLVYVIDANDLSRLPESKEVFTSLIRHEHLMSKPCLILANKQDLPNSADHLDIIDYYDIHNLANSTKTPCLVENSAAFKLYPADGLINAFQWLVTTIEDNFKRIKNRNAFITKHTKSPSISANRPRTAVNSVRSREKLFKVNSSLNRPKTAPSLSSIVPRETSKMQNGTATMPENAIEEIIDIL